ncbi:unnamed protein product [Ostreobium quekettii]|uniref:BZIP domain-containing protein n=1 Tax=Ostreobium quekettii TaxID=121088 RepID=A0A8S1IMY5_9CHLO|nr:unnamed protein product [Ostreobium quekettii]|eukprot:evm.model.scf_829.2 EVM.evm.TU.scf_829.2   scf_829:9995-13931(+)
MGREGQAEVSVMHMSTESAHQCMGVSSTPPGATESRLGGRNPATGHGRAFAEFLGRLEAHSRGPGQSDVAAQAQSSLRIGWGSEAPGGISPRNIIRSSAGDNPDANGAQPILDILPDEALSKKQARARVHRRTQRQLQLNKFSQKRYRERQKKLKTQMEEQLAELKQRCAILEQAKHERDALEDKVCQLNSVVEIQRMFIASLQKSSNDSRQSDGHAGTTSSLAIGSKLPVDPLCGQRDRCSHSAPTAALPRPPHISRMRSAAAPASAPCATTMATSQGQAMHTCFHPISNSSASSALAENGLLISPWEATSSAKTQCRRAHGYHIEEASPSKLAVARPSPPGMEGKPQTRFSGDALQIDIANPVQPSEAHIMMVEAQQARKSNRQELMHGLNQITHDPCNARSEIPETECEMHIKEADMVSRSSSGLAGNGAEASGVQKWMTRIGEEVQAIHKLLSQNTACIRSGAQLPDELEQDLRYCLSGVLEAAAQTSTSEVSDTCTFLHGPAVHQDPRDLQKMRNCLALLNLRQSQREVICRLRQQHFAHLANVYEERSRLSDQASSACSGNPNAQNAMEMLQRRMQRNAKRERQIVLDSLHMLLLSLLDPLQAAILVIDAYAGDVNVLNMAMTLASIEGTSVE